METKIDEILLNKKPTKATYITKEDLTESELIKEKLQDEERLIAEFIDFTYKVPEESVLGRKELFITNKGRFILHDSGGFLGVACCYSAEGIISSFNQSICKMELEVKGNVEIKAKITVEDFLNLAEETPNIKTEENNVSTVLFDEEYEYSVNIEKLEEKIKIKNIDIKSLKDIDINYSFIKSIDFHEENQKCTITAYSEEKSTIEEYKFIFFSKELYEEIKDKIESLKSKLIDIIKENSKVIKANILQQDDNNKDFQSEDSKKESILIINDKQIDMYDKTLENHITLDIDECSFLQNPFDDNHIFLLTTIGILQLFKKITINNIKYKSLKELEGNKVILIKDNGYKLLDLEFEDSSLIFKEKEKVVIIKTKEIKEINIKDTKDSNNVKLEIKAEEDYICIINKDMYFSILQQWMAGSIGENEDLKGMITLWSRSLKDIMAFYYFSPLQETKDILDSILNGNLDVSILSKEDRLLIINSLYRILNVYNKGIMEFSLKLPEELLEELVGEEEDVPRNIDDFEQRVMNIYYNLNKNVERVLDNLKSLHDYIYPEVDMNKVLNKRNYKVGTTTMDQYSGLDNIIKTYDLIGILKLRGTALGNLNSRYEKVNMHGEQKINIYLNNAIIEFYNLMDFVVPKYNNDLIRITKELGEIISKEYTDKDKEFIQSIVVYNKIFIETSISSNIEKPKKSVLERIGMKSELKDLDKGDVFKFSKKKRKDFDK